MNLSTKPTSNSSRSGFTLIEIVAAIALSMLILGGVFNVASACFGLSSTITEKNQTELHSAAFFDLLRRNFSAMPGNGKMTMELPGGVGSSANYSEIVLQDYPLAFAWGGVAAGSERILLVSEKDPTGAVQVRIRYLNEEQAEAHENGSLAEDDGLSLVLIDGIKSIYWQFFDTNEEEWVEEWEEEERRPSLVELNVEFFGLSEKIRSVFWIPVVANPESVVRGAQSTPRTGTGGGRNTGGGGGQNTTGRPPTGGGDQPVRAPAVPPGGGR